MHSDITYGTNNEFGFDYLRDNMKFDAAHCVQREHHFAIVDEVDSILIDEARTPLIISGPSEESTDKYYRIDKIVPQLRRDIDYQVDEKNRTSPDRRRQRAGRSAARNREIFTSPRANMSKSCTTSIRH